MVKDQEQEKKVKSGEDNSDFNWLQKWVFPVRMVELPKVIPVVLLMGIALLIYTANRDVKDAVIFGEEAQTIVTVQYCKVVVMATAIPTAAIFMKLGNMVSFPFIFFQTVLTFGAYFVITGLTLLPYRDVMHQFGSEAIRSIKYSNDAQNVARLAPLAGTFVFPVTTISYVFSELWGTISVSFLVWGYVNQVTPKSAAKRYYSVLGIGAQFGSIIGASFVGAQSASGRSFEENMTIMNVTMAGLCVVFAAVFAFLQFYIMQKPQFAVKEAGKGKKGKPKMTVGEAFKYCLKDRYVLALCGMVFAYGFVMVLGEMTYKDIMKLSFNDNQSDYAGFKSLESNFTSGVAIFLMIFVGHNVIRMFGWLAAALMTPVVCALLVVTMYILAIAGDFYMVDDNDKKKPKDEAINYLHSLRNLGLAFAVASKGVKYAAFDPAKELAFLALTQEQKYKAKAAVDIIGARFGKGGGAVFNILAISLAIGAEVSYEQNALIVSLIGVAAGLVIWVMSDIYIGANKDAVSAKTEAECAAKASPMESVHVEGRTEKSAAELHIEMSTAPDASFTEGPRQTPLPSRQNTPEA